MRDHVDRDADLTGTDLIWTDLTWIGLRRAAAQQLAGGASTNPGQEARWIVEEVSGLRGAALVDIEREGATDAAARRVEVMVARRLDGEPLQYVLGSWSFRGIDLFVDPRVLIPRPETELTVQLALDEAVRLGARQGRRAAWSGTDSSFVVADLGTGSGAIAIVLATELPDAEVWATDVSSDALAVTRANLAGAGSVATNVRVAEGDWFAAIPDDRRGRLQVVVSNPPYVAEAEVHELAPEVGDHEPRGALVSGATGLESIARIVADAPLWLGPSGAVVIELDPRRAEAAVELALGAGFGEARVERDPAGRARVLVARLG
jgi:release factor glutamine methyltransferase